jgi:hypothetical protein
MTEPRQGPLAAIRHWFRDLVLIVVSILIAFSLEAWWGNRGEADLTRLHLESLVNEMRENREAIEFEYGGVQDSHEGTMAILAIMAGDPEDVDPQDVASAFILSVNVGTFIPGTTALSAMTASGELMDLDHPRLLGLLSRWQGLQRNLELDAAHLERNREETLVDQLTRNGYDVGMLLEPGPGNEREFTRLLSDPAIRTVFNWRMIRSVQLMDAFDEAVQVLDELIPLLDAEIEDWS